MRNILLTGGNGFIGRNLVESLQHEYQVYAPSHKDLDLLDFKALFSYVNSKKIDTIIHAAIHVPEVNGTEREFFYDMQMFLNIEKLSCFVDKIIYFGSGAEFDKRFDIQNVSEDSFGDSIPASEYGLAKYAMTKIARASQNIYNLRLFGVFGKYELWQVKFISNLCCKAIYDLPLTIRKDCSFNYLYIDDLTNVVKWFINHTPKYHDYNVCHDQSFALSELAHIVRDISNKELEIVLLSDAFNVDYTANNRRLHTECPAFQVTDMRQAIKSLYDYYDKNKSLIDYGVLKASR